MLSMSRWLCRGKVHGSSCAAVNSWSRRLCGEKRSLCSAADSPVLVENRGQVRVIGLNRPASRNAVNRDTALALYQTFQAFDSDHSAHVAVLHGVGGNFCAGYDLKELASSDRSPLQQAVGTGPAPMGPTHLELSKPVVCAVSGYAVAGGLELALMCDLRVVEEGAVMGVFCRRFGVPLIDGGTVRLPALIGLSRAMDLILTGRPIKSEEALNIGLANRVVPDGQALEEAITLAQELSSFPQKCMRADRSSAIRQALSGDQAETLQDPLDQEFQSGGEVLAEAIEGATQFTRGKGKHGSFKN